MTLAPHEFEQELYRVEPDPTLVYQEVETFDFSAWELSVREKLRAMGEDPDDPKYSYGEPETVVLGPVVLFEPPDPNVITIVPPTIVPMVYEDGVTLGVQSIQQLADGVGVVNVYYGNRWVMGYQVGVDDLEAMENVMFRRGQKAQATRVRARTLQGPGRGRRVEIRGEGAELSETQDPSDNKGFWDRFFGWM